MTKPFMQPSTIRIHMFSEYPYLEDGKKYLQIYVNAPEYTVMPAWNDLGIVGVSMAMPLLIKNPVYSKRMLEG